MRDRLPRASSRRHGVVLIMVIGILATLALAGTAFVIVMSQEDRAAANALYLTQAELAARSGLEHAIGAIEQAHAKLADGTWLAVTPDGVLLADGVTFVRDEAPANGSLDTGWHRCFEVDSGGEQLSDPALWVSHYAGGKFGAEAFGHAAVPHEMRGRVIGFPSAGGTTKRGEYAVCVVDLDGKLHANVAQWNGGVGSDASGLPASLLPCMKAVAGHAGLSGDESEALKREAAAAFYSSTSEIARRVGVSASAEKYALERFFTPYPVPHHEDAPRHDVSGTPTYTLASDTSSVTLASAALVPDAMIGHAAVFEGDGRAFGVVDNEADSLVVRGDCSGEPADSRLYLVPRPAVNVNTVPEALLAELVKPICGFLAAIDPAGPDKADALAKHLCSIRPFGNRHELEDAVFRLVGGQLADGTMLPFPGNGAIAELPDGAGNLTERQFNDFLNSAAPGAAAGAGPAAADESAFDEPDAPGVYSFDGWEPFADGTGPAQTGGSRTNGSDVTWSTELKFRSRFFHVYVIGRAWHVATAEPVGVKRLHAVYDSSTKRLVWMRWNLSSRGSVTDMTVP